MAESKEKNDIFKAALIHAFILVSQLELVGKIPVCNLKVVVYSNTVCE